MATSVGNVQQTYTFITNDFESAWDSLAAQPRTSALVKGRGNFIFGLHATILLEFLCRLCVSGNPQAIQDFSNELNSINPRYFTVLPITISQINQFALPYRASPQSEVVQVVFDLIRNGQAHQYQQIQANLSNNKVLIIRLSGADYAAYLSNSRANYGRAHLGFRTDSQGNILIHVCPDVLYLDIKDAAVQANLLNRGLTLNYFFRSYGTTSQSIESALTGAGHGRLPR